VVEPEQFARAEVPLVPTERVVDCPLCQGDAADCFAEGYDYELESCRNRWRFVQCRRCGHLWLDPRPAVEALGVIYPSHYYAYDFAHRIHPIALRGKAWLDARRLAAIRRRLARPPTTYLDVGCGDGRFLRAMERLGIPRDLLFGLELDHRIATRLREEGYQVECARVETSTLVADASLDLITMFHVIEHLATPVETVAKLARWLRPGGILALETPNRSSLDARLFRRTFWGGYHFPRHWHLFDAAGVVGLIRQAGLRPVGVRYQTGHSFWLYSIHHWLRYGPWRMPRLARAFDPIGALVPLVIATGFDKVRAAMGFPTSAVLVMGQKPGPA
jgi:SAM-dependent methyltransferase